MRVVVIILSSLVFIGCNYEPMPSKVAIHSEHISPDGRYVATAFDRDSGATTSWSPQVDIRPVGQNLDKYGNVFIGYGSPNIDTKWLSSSQLVVYIDTNCEIDLHATNYYGITVELRHAK